MTEVLHFASPPSTDPSASLSRPPPANDEEEEESSVEEDIESAERGNREQQLPVLALLVAVLRKSLVACKSDRSELCGMEIGWPTDVRHVAHVTFDRFDGFLGLPVEFEPEVPRRAPSASTHVFGVSTESMQLSHDSRGNSIPTILLLMQRRLYAQGGLQAEGIFRINAENSQGEFVRDHLNRGIIPEGIDVHCLAGLIKAWFRELPRGVLDSLSPEQVMLCQTEEDCAELVRLLPPTEAALLDWAINLMCDVAQMEHQNKMNARNIAMVFAPNMTQMGDPLTALMYAVQVMNFLKTLIARMLREREDAIFKSPPTSHTEPPDDNGHQSPQICVEFTPQANKVSVSSHKNGDTIGEGSRSCEIKANNFDGLKAGAQLSKGKFRLGQTSISNIKSFHRKIYVREPAVQVSGPVEKTGGISTFSRIDSRIEWIEAWR
ncbi:rho GTPase-activating protein 1 [Rhodamnia argentea]|uniref:Rho GTPase-activating protein 1 n=1 Tax=Rhodamnia argentea TaxID=178133 RepID=A0A8B8NFD8_9MYRT|nr:rho GTPase-activating protein 1 [Rhodamnia argentea]